MGNLFFADKLLKEELTEDMSTSAKLGDWVFKSSWNIPLFIVKIIENSDLENSNNVTSVPRQSRNNVPLYTVYEFDVTSNKVVETLIKGNASFWYRTHNGTDQNHLDGIINKCISILNKREFISYKNGFDAINTGINIYIFGILLKHCNNET